MTFAELEIRLNRWAEEARFEVELNYRDSETPVDLRLAADRTALVTFPPALWDPEPEDLLAHGQALCDALFVEKQVEQFFTDAAARAKGCPLQLRLRISGKLPRLHGLRWEALCDPRDRSWLATRQDVLFSRYLDSSVYRLPRPRGDERLRALVVIASPDDTVGYKDGQNRPLVKVDEAKELARAMEALKGCGAVDELTGPEASLERMLWRLADGYDILYLACHGTLTKGKPYLLLADGQNKGVLEHASSLAEQFEKWPHLPFVVVLASCQSAGKDKTARGEEFSTLSAIGPRLVEVGVPAVLAMQGDVTQQTVGEFMPPFFGALLKEGQVDAAVTQARMLVQKQPDWWRPVLFSRFASGELWYKHGLQPGRRVGGAASAFDKWDALFTNLEQDPCTPILGGRLLDPLLGPREEIARHWADRFGFPLDGPERQNLAQVAQFLAAAQNDGTPANQLVRYLREEVTDRLLQANVKLPADRKLGPLLEALHDQEQAQAGARGVYEVLASLPFRVYLTTAADGLLEAALRKENPRRQPQVLLFDWRLEEAEAGGEDGDEDEEGGGDEDEEGDGIITEKVPSGRPPTGANRKKQRTHFNLPPQSEPLVYHLFGTFDYQRLLVLSEDNHHDFLIAMAQAQQEPRRGLIPAVVKEVLSHSALLLLGFRLTDLEFRVVLRGLRLFMEGRPPNRYTSVAVQINPALDGVTDLGVARRFLERQLGAAGADIAVYWGTEAEFVRDLLAECARRQVAIGGGHANG
jgi:hypothetical protein